MSYPEVHLELRYKDSTAFKATLEVRPKSRQHYKVKHWPLMFALYCWRLINARFAARWPYITTVTTDGTVYGDAPSDRTLIHEFWHLYQNHREGRVVKFWYMLTSRRMYAYYELEAMAVSGKSREEAVASMLAGAYWLRGLTAADLMDLWTTTGLDQWEDP